MRKLLMVSVNRYDVLPSFDASKRIDVQYSPWYEEWMVKISTEFDCFALFANVPKATSRLQISETPFCYVYFLLYLR